ncbi:hypothetical protein ACU4GD_14225 [Cupriavidus basilensis]
MLSVLPERQQLLADGLGQPLSRGLVRGLRFRQFHAYPTFPLLRAGQPYLGLCLGRFGGGPPCLGDGSRLVGFWCVPVCSAAS